MEDRNISILINNIIINGNRKRKRKHKFSQLLKDLDYKTWLENNQEHLARYVKEHGLLTCDDYYQNNEEIYNNISKIEYSVNYLRQEILENIVILRGELDCIRYNK